MSQSHRVLLVDDEVNLLQAFQRNLRGRYELVTAPGGQAALDMLENHEPFAVIVSDMQMPEVDGMQVLSEARKLAPDTVRIMLTGNVDQSTAVAAVNSGEVFRFLNKPCPFETFTAALDDGLHHYRIAIAEKELLSKTLAGCVALVNELLSIANPISFGRGGRIRQWIKRLGASLSLPNLWQYEIAAMLSQLGSVGELSKQRGLRLESLEDLQHELKTQAAVSSSMVSKIPKLETIAAMIGSQYTTHGATTPVEVGVGAKLLRMLIEYDIVLGNRTPAEAISKLRENANAYHDQALELFASMVLGKHTIKSLDLDSLLDGMILETDVTTTSGEILLSHGHELTGSMIQRLRNFSRNGIPVVQPIVVRVQCAAN
jgi:CheY-like chemotaxis protein